VYKEAASGRILGKKEARVQGVFYLFYYYERLLSILRYSSLR
jgi:hypothetical protein